MADKFQGGVIFTARCLQPFSLYRGSNDQDSFLPLCHRPAVQEVPRMGGISPRRVASCSRVLAFPRWEEFPPAVSRLTRAFHRLQRLRGWDEFRPMVAWARCWRHNSGGRKFSPRRTCFLLGVCRKPI
ncbi:hypothetical protein FA13DRAFT_1092538 [Coprinellus micaceus]|uniref:Uncharacterized protein n=1 Tax=Coprinellus micaceus TaxID=71717 RepID=A0A4Y7TS31_COPMI|nr:hypothetical protein FA13DRAFT_1092538 [Coprinellus micaceus]